MVSPGVSFASDLADSELSAAVTEYFPFKRIQIRIQNLYSPIPLLARLFVHVESSVLPCLQGHWGGYNCGCDVPKYATVENFHVGLGEI